MPINYDFTSFEAINSHNGEQVGGMCDQTLLHNRLKLKTANKTIKFKDNLSLLSRKL